MNRYYLGIDGGQSSTTALIADEDGNILGAGRGGPCNHASGEAGRLKFFNAVSGCVNAAFAEAGLSRESVQFEAACLGFSGGPGDKDQYSRELISAKQFHITHDAEIALAGATAGEPGVIIIAGTGSMAFGSNASGKFARAGGWGYVFGDEGGAFDVVRQAVRAVLRAEEGWGPQTLLSEMLLQATGAATANDMLHRFYTPDFTRQQIAALAPLVEDAGQRGDAIARSVLNGAARDLTQYVQGVLHNLFQPHDRPPVCYVGGLFASAVVRNAFIAEMEDATGIRPQAPIFNPAAGAILSALRLGGRPAVLVNPPRSVK